MGAFTWRRMEGPWSCLPGGPMLDEHWSGLLPNHVLTGFPATAFGGLVDAGVAVGWLHHAAAFVKRSFLGKGWLTVSTFDLASPQAHENPLAPHLMKALVGSEGYGFRDSSPQPEEMTMRPSISGLHRRPSHSRARASPSLRAEQSAARGCVGRSHPEDRRGRRIERGPDASPRHPELTESAIDCRACAPDAQGPPINLTRARIELSLGGVDEFDQAAAGGEADD